MWQQPSPPPRDDSCSFRIPKAAVWLVLGLLLLGVLIALIVMVARTASTLGQLQLQLKLKSFARPDDGDAASRVMAWLKNMMTKDAAA